MRAIFSALALSLVGATLVALAPGAAASPIDAIEDLLGEGPDPELCRPTCRGESAEPQPCRPSCLGDLDPDQLT